MFYPRTRSKMHYATIKTIQTTTNISLLKRSTMANNSVWADWWTSNWTWFESIPKTCSIYSTLKILVNRSSGGVFTGLLSSPVGPPSDRICGQGRWGRSRWSWSSSSARQSRGRHSRHRLFSQHPVKIHDAIQNPRFHAHLVKIKLFYLKQFSKKI